MWTPEPSDRPRNLHTPFSARYDALGEYISRLVPQGPPRSLFHPALRVATWTAMGVQPVAIGFFTWLSSLRLPRHIEGGFWLGAGGILEWLIGQARRGLAVEAALGIATILLGVWVVWRTKRTAPRDDAGFGASLRSLHPRLP